MVQYTHNRMKQGIENMNLKPKQIALLKSMASAGVVSPVTRQDIVDACEATGAYACPPSWLTRTI